MVEFQFRFIANIYELDKLDNRIFIELWIFDNKVKEEYKKIEEVHTKNIN